MQKILAIDDKKDNLIILSALLKNLMPDCALITAQSGREGIRKAEGELPDVILLDVRMPDMDGFETCRRLMACESTKSIPVIMMTATKTDPESRVKGLECGANTFLSKPIDATELVSQVKVALRIKKAEDALRMERNSLERMVQERTANLRESEELYRTLFENMLNGFAYCRMLFDQGEPADFVYLAVNSAFESLTGLKNVVGKKVSEAIPGIRELDPELFEIYGRVALTGKHERFEKYVNALRMWFSISVYSPVKEHFVVVFDVITDRKRAEDALRNSEEKYRRIVETANEGIWVMDGEFRTTFVNQRMAEMLGFTAAEMQGRRMDSFMFPQDQADHATKIEARIQGQAGIYERRFLRSDGKTLWTIVSASPLMDFHGRFTGSFAMCTNITERKLAEEKLRDAETLYRMLFEHSPDGVVIIDPATARPLDFNETAHRQLGYSHEEFAQLSIPDLDADKTPEEIRSRIVKVLRDGRNDFETRHRTKHGEIRHIHVTSQITEILGKPVYHCIWRDITDRKKGDELLRKTLESLRKAVGTTVEVMASAVEIRDPYTAGHQTRSADLARAIATEMGLSEEKIEGVSTAGSIHDIGKLSIPAEILSKPASLSEIEFALIKEHAERGYDILKDVKSPWPLAEIVYQHHERLDGSGYPRKLKGDGMLLEARILAVADVVEAIASHRPYRPALGIDAALAEIGKNSGTLYDEAVVGACLRLFQDKGFQFKRM